MQGLVLPPERSRGTAEAREETGSGVSEGGEVTHRRQVQPSSQLPSLVLCPERSPVRFLPKSGLCTA